MKNIIGFIIILFGFCAPFLSKGFIGSIWFFWIGFFLLLNPEKHIPISGKSLKWARKGLLANMIMFLILTIYFYLPQLNIKPISLSVFLHNIYVILEWIGNPIRKLYNLISPISSYESPDGVVTFRLSFISSITTTFINILVYLLIGVLVGKHIIKDNQSVAPDGSQVRRP